MSFFSAKLSPQSLEKIISKLEKFEIDSNQKTILHLFDYKNCKITIYTTNKLLIQGKQAEKVAQSLGLCVMEKKVTVTAESKKYLQYIGSDEVGVGDYFGGLVVCSAYVDEEVIKKLELFNVRDSKKMNDEEIKNIFQKIKAFLNYEVKLFTAKEYNNFIAKFDNTHIAKAYLHNEAIKSLKEKNNFQSCPVVLDQFVAEKNYYNYFQILNNRPEKIDVFCTQAESKYIGVAAASIVARYYFLEQIKKMEIDLKFTIPLGSSSPKVIEFARRIPIKNLPDFVKIDFSTTKKL